MRVFVLCSGRCGSTTFVKAASHISNYTAAHESRWGIPRLSPRLDYPDRHIEADNRLAWLTGPLLQRYGSDPDARFVHLTRDTAATAASFVSWNGALLEQGWIRALLCMGSSRRMTPEQKLAAATSLVETINLNIGLFMARVGERGMAFRLENAAQDWTTFWSWIGAAGSLSASLAEWKVRHNASARSVAR